MPSQELRLDAPEVGTRRMSSFEDFYGLMSNLHDCPFDLEEAVLDDASGAWTAAFVRPLWESPNAQRERRKLIFSRWLNVTCYRLPVARGVVRVDGVTKARIVSNQGIRHYAFCELKRIEIGIRFESCMAMKIDLRLRSGIDATYEEQDLPGVRAIFDEFPFGAQSGPSLENVATESA